MSTIAVIKAAVHYRVIQERCGTCANFKWFKAGGGTMRAECVKHGFAVSVAGICDEFARNPVTAPR